MNDWLATSNATRFECELRMRVLLRIFRRLNIPVKASKTVWPSQCVVFLGIIVNTLKQTLTLPEDKRLAAINLLSEALRAYTSNQPSACSAPSDTP